MYDKVGNLPEAWEGSADSLLSAARLLRAARDAARQSTIKVGDAVSDGERAFPSEIMLRGFALECLFKALWVKRGHVLALQGKLRRTPGAGNHELLQLADTLEFKCEPNERDLLKRLSLFTTSVGRYPIATDWSKTKIQKAFSGGTGPPTYWMSPSDDDAYSAVLTRIEAELAR
jgi:hypothetical protein